MVSERFRRRIPPWVATAALFGYATADCPYCKVHGNIKDELSKDEAKQCHGREEEFGECPSLQPCTTCVPVDCVFGAWSHWAANHVGGCAGLNSRMRTIGKLNNECGKPCQGPTGETRSYIDPKCSLEPVDCVFSVWSSWSKCGSDSDQSYRLRKITTEAVNGGKPCEGETRQTQECGQPPVPVPCGFSDWYEWTSCSVSCDAGRKTRLRKVVQTPKFGGTPCSGATLEVKVCQEKGCHSEDAQVGKWTEWSDCEGTSLQKRRTRTISSLAEGTGLPFHGVVEEIGACPPPTARNCLFAAWSDWSACDKTCQKSRKRNLDKAPANGGSCQAGIKVNEIVGCNVKACAPPVAQDCKLSGWSAWTACNNQCGAGSMNRTRSVLQSATKGGEACMGSLLQIKSCTGAGKNCGAVDCEWFDWSSWGACSCDFGGGSKSRHRVIKTVPKHGGKLCDAKDKKEVAPCNTQACKKECVDGKWELWSHWSVCSTTCGTGYKSRSRQVATKANGCGKALEGVREDFQACKATQACSRDVDCEISEWSAWSSCSCKCMGIKERTRYIKTFVAGNGKPCNGAAMKETSSCNDDPHTPACGGVVQNCELSLWEVGKCSRTCGGGQQEKRRHIVKNAMGGGKACSGDLVTSVPCNTQPCGKEVCTDCRWGTWGSWSDCTHCGGQRFRHRNVDQMANECGKPCASVAAQEMGDCKSTCPLGEYICKWSEWSDVTCPTKGCGDTSALRTRSLGFTKLDNSKSSLEASFEGSLFVGHMGAICTGSEVSLQLCDRKECECTPIDCAFNEWEDWSRPSCEGLCQRTRTINGTNNECGAPCTGSLIETKKCPVACGAPEDCVWGQWTQWSACTTAYGQKTRSRKVGSAPNWRGKPCNGEATETTACFTSPSARNCQLSTWSAFDTCSASCGGGVRSRHRSVVSEASENGKLCSGSLEDAENCNTQPCVSHDVDCQLGPWTAWSHCDPDNQKQRTRFVKVEAQNNGRRCAGDLKLVVSCNTKVIDCKMSEWTNWDQCDRECDGGQKRRHRQIAVYPKNGGKLCPTGIVELAACNAKPCLNVDCKIHPWAAWGECSAECQGGQQTRVRAIAQFRAGVGKGCTGKLEETRQCNLQACQRQDCAWSDWQDWDTCTCSCNGGTTKRSRDIELMPRNKGKPCAVQDKEQVKPCNTGPCEAKTCVDGEWSNWGDWSVCSSSCNGGTTYRERHQKVTPNSCGKPASGPSHDVGFCNIGVVCEAPVDCEFSTWSAWDACTKTCDGVTRRSRRITKYGRGTGKWCLGATKQTNRCNKACEAKKVPVDCVVGKWAEWSACTKKCGGGQRYRSRHIEKYPADGGKTCEGDLEKVEECNRHACEDFNTPVDCELTDWEDWGSCSQAGEMLRERTVKTFPKNHGKECNKEDLQEVKPCDLGHTKIFCTWADWTDWGQCSAKCGTGRRGRTRDIVASLKQVPSPLKTEDILKRFEALQLQTSSLEEGHFSELAAAFAAGMLTLAVGFGAWRACGRSRRPLENRDVLLSEQPNM
eukprot:TRINITY_DN4788_c0_g2_i1.p1 TRINITY_DN4788_c0_g2~~TRINITY_DN4788_c0_g2_i1.p1  ORF type:complete len:1519 (-),score=327.65 TRINITY_DN4788_c0_g2_i1:305-4861(-)